MKARLAPEQERAVRVYFQNAEQFPRKRVFRLQELHLDHVTVANSQVFVQGDVTRKTIPREGHWEWHQSKSKLTVDIPGGHLIVTKFNPRKVKYCNYPCPSYKLWTCQIVNHTSKGELYFIWCEKGKITPNAPAPLIRSSSAPECSSKNSEEILLSDFRS